MGLISFNWIILWLATDKTSTIISRLFFEKFSSKYRNFDILQYRGMKNWYYWGILIVTLSPSFSSMSKLKDPKCSWSANRVTLVVAEGRRRSILGKYENRLVIIFIFYFYFFSNMKTGWWYHLVPGGLSLQHAHCAFIAIQSCIQIINEIYLHCIHCKHCSSAQYLQLLHCFHCLHFLHCLTDC